MTQPSTSRRDKLISGVIAALVAVILYQAVARVPPEPQPTAAAEPVVQASACPAPLKLYRPARKADFSTDFYGMRYHGNTGNELDMVVLFTGAWEKPILYFLRDTLTSAAGKDGVFIDVGANVGQHSMFMSQFAKRVHSFEPYERVLKIFRTMQAENKLENITIHPVGLGAKAETVPFFEPPDNNLGTGSFLPNFYPGNHAGTPLRIVIGDEALREAAVERVDLMKIDIEGYEKPALAGLKQTLKKHRPIVVMEITINPAETHLFTSEKDLMAAFPEGYEFRMFDPTVGREISGEYRLLKVVLDFKVAQQHDLVVFPPEKRKFIQLTGGGDGMAAKPGTLR